VNSMEHMPVRFTCDDCGKAWSSEERTSFYRLRAIAKPNEDGTQPPPLDKSICEPCYEDWKVKHKPAADALRTPTSEEVRAFHEANVAETLQHVSILDLS
jgi:hypothetical protein